jgi:RNA polymerase sigma-70 factor, ECF subfamily
MDQAAFRSFYQKTAPALRAYIARCAGSVDLADDILQDVFMRFLLSAPSIGNEAAMRGYLYRTAETLVVDRWRQRQRERRRDLAAAELRQQTVEPDYSDDISRAFRNLKPQQRSLLWMAYVEGLDHREIAFAAGLKEGSVRVLLSRARKVFAAAVNRLGLRPEARYVK